MTNSSGKTGVQLKGLCMEKKKISNIEERGKPCQAWTSTHRHHKVIQMQIQKQQNLLPVLCNLRSNIKMPENRTVDMHLQNIKYEPKIQS